MMNHKKAFRKKITVRNYVIALLKQSILTGVPQIFFATNFRRYWKILVLFSCIIGFCYQMGTFLRIYWKYPIMEEADNYFFKDIALPAITICNYNGLSRSKYCKDYPDNCLTLEKNSDFCKRFPNSCLLKENITSIQIPKPEYSVMEKNAPREIVLKYGQQKEELLRRCTLTVSDKSMACPNITVSFVNFYEDIPRICHTINGRYRNAKKLPILKVNIDISGMNVSEESSKILIFG
ncbi:uncharacterized protein LOC111632651 [Centruroides sculpturatus]|uniref:uncharacterized protein LOC111632651 n=1 Tax=Centruroides sculpturatus TaxID=218467 RepID=UPI000C6CBE37|nr:uncharacterized protein LOC111632651 [Centruroides sculpturatus]